MSKVFIRGASPSYAPGQGQKRRKPGEGQNHGKQVQ